MIHTEEQLLFTLKKRIDLAHNGNTFPTIHSQLQVRTAFM